MTIINDYNTYSLALTVNNYAQLYNYLILIAKNKCFSLKTADILNLYANKACKDIEHMYFIFNQSLINTNKIQLSLFIYPRFALNKGYNLTNFLLDNFLQKNDIQSNMVKIEFKMSSISIDSGYIDIHDTYCNNISTSKDFLKFKASIDSYLRVVGLLLSFIAKDVKFNIEVNLSKMNHLDLIHKIDESTIPLKHNPKALDRVLCKAQATNTLDISLYNRNDSNDKIIYQPKLYKAKDITIKKDTKIPTSLKRVLDNE